MAYEFRGDPAGRVRAALRLALARIRARGMADGRAAATADSPAFLGNPALIAAGWAASSRGPGGRQVVDTDRDEYFLAWVHGYVGRADELDDAPPARECPAE